ncbi:hypothetical protein [Burkholderia gladioli]|uniref:hypothetical protein n=1 Tax=Burkholderia gladioli TaxID=28095 RepID=UPI00164100B6|nr:hypothetical protein [Burkholderia gladioli]
MRNHTFKPGDLAIVARCGNSSHIGMVVRIIKPSDFPGFDWSVAILSGPVIGRNLKTGRHGFYSKASVYNWNLMPLGDESLLADEQEASHA